MAKTYDDTLDGYEQLVLRRLEAIRPPRKAVFVNGLQFHAAKRLHERRLVALREAPVDGHAEAGYVFPVDDATPASSTAQQADGFRGLGLSDSDRRDETDDLSIYGSVAGGAR